MSKVSNRRKHRHQWGTPTRAMFQGRTVRTCQKGNCKALKFAGGRVIFIPNMHSMDNTTEAEIAEMNGVTL